MFRRPMCLGVRRRLWWGVEANVDMPIDGSALHADTARGQPKFTDASLVAAKVDPCIQRWSRAVLDLG